MRMWSWRSEVRVCDGKQEDTLQVNFLKPLLQPLSSVPSVFWFACYRCCAIPCWYFGSLLRFSVMHPARPHHFSSSPSLYSLSRIKGHRCFQRMIGGAECKLGSLRSFTQGTWYSHHLSMLGTYAGSFINRAVYLLWVDGRLKERISLLDLSWYLK